MENEIARDTYKPRCNICGDELDFWDIDQGFAINTLVGYGSRNDGSHVYLRMCCNCFDDIVTRCKLSPVVSVEAD